MLHRIVQMTFREDATEEFLRIYQEMAPVIGSFPGCRHLELWRNSGDPLRFATYSVWDDSEALEAYRTSEAFRRTWSRVRPLFSEPARADSYVSTGVEKSIT
ncbi:MAG TPA: antibiotic biosynthesis monooxygenase family protein [Rhodothermales bacterium]